MRIQISALLCAFSLLAPCAVAANAPDPREAQALWLSKHLHRPVEASQVLASPEGALEGCTIARAHAVPTGATSLSLRCPDYALPQLVLLNLPDTDGVIFGVPLVATGAASDKSQNESRSISSKIKTEKASPLVRAGAKLQADWRTPFLHAEMPVVALDSGVAGAEIRVRVADSSRIMRARILTAHTVSIVAGA
jgi:hypothetical protein